MTTEDDETPEQPLLDVLATFQSVALAEFDQAQLHDRVERKVLVHTKALPEVLKALSENYLILQHLGDRIQGYTTCYLDDEDLQDYRDHHNRKRSRKKVRYRTYENSSMTFFEVKMKRGGRTVKERQPSAPHAGQLWENDAHFLEARTDARGDELLPVLTVSYDRILLVKRDYSERVTIDMNLLFESRTAKSTADHLAVCEIKQPRLDRTSPAFRAFGRRSHEFSKYCVGLAACDHLLKQNRFKNTFRVLDRLDVHLSTMELAQ